MVKRCGGQTLIPERSVMRIVDVLKRAVKSTCCAGVVALLGACGSGEVDPGPGPDGVETFGSGRGGYSVFLCTGPEGDQVRCYRGQWLNGSELLCEDLEASYQCVLEQVVEAPEKWNNWDNG